MLALSNPLRITIFCACLIDSSLITARFFSAYAMTLSEAMSNRISSQNRTKTLRK